MFAKPPAVLLLQTLWCVMDCVVCSPDVTVRTNTVVVMVMRLFLMKITVFNTLMTIYIVIKW